MNFFVFSTGKYFYFINKSFGYICNIEEVLYSIFDYALNHNDLEIIDYFKSRYEIPKIEKAIQTIRYYQEKGLCTPVLYNDLNVSREYTEKAFINNYNKCEQLLLQVTEACQFNCKYCFYGEMYNTTPLHPNKVMSVETAITIIKERLEIWNGLGGISRLKKYYIGFYGGEPLLNFDLISTVVDFVNQNKKNLKIQFNITTNAFLLLQYIDFFIENDFEILISLDGDRKANQNRILKNGRETYEDVINCCDAIMRKNKDYFSKRVYFNSVFTSKSNLKNIISFFYNKYGKYPVLTAVNSFGVRKEKKDMFEAMYSNLLQETHQYLLENKNLLYKNENNAINDQILDFMRNNDLDYFAFFPGSIARRSESIRNGTCSPFFKKIYVDVEGNILPCEKLYKKVVLGKVENGSVLIDYNNLLDSFVSLILNCSELCKHCFNATTCNQCLYSCFDNEKCIFFTDYHKGLEKTVSLFRVLESHRELLDYYYMR